MIRWSSRRNPVPTTLPPHFVTASRATPVFTSWNVSDQSLGAALAVGVGLALDVGEGLTEVVVGAEPLSVESDAGTQPVAEKARRPPNRPILVLVLRAVFFMTDLPQ
jgi:hypothetical protein